MPAFLMPSRQHDNRHWFYRSSVERQAITPAEPHTEPHASTAPTTSQHNLTAHLPVTSPKKAVFFKKIAKNTNFFVTEKGKLLGTL